MPLSWKKDRGKMGFMAPALGAWRTEIPDTPMGKVICMRSYEKALGGKFIRLVADWDIGEGSKTYREEAFYGLDRDGTPSFWSFTTDGGTSQGRLADVTDLHPEAFGFEAQMPAGLARMGFWPDVEGMMWVTQSKTKKGWNDLARHHYFPASS